jgi:hypothetical protein
VGRGEVGRAADADGGVRVRAPPERDAGLVAGARRVEVQCGLEGFGVGGLLAQEECGGLGPS